MKDPIVLSMYARKGGAGRTIMCLQLAGACAEYGANVLVIDQDPQGSLSKNLFGAGAVERLRPYETTAAIYDKDIDDYSRVIRQTEIPNIAIVLKQAIEEVRLRIDNRVTL
ncbi:MAG: AAA family ATPase [Planctomycetales bacterium]|nr:AAA family ATPase [Planctomycetales bacterium]